MSVRTVALVTGSNAGLGMLCVESMLKHKDAPSLVVMACRNITAANEAAAKITANAKVNRARIVILPESLDLSSLASVRAYAAAFRRWLAAPSQGDAPLELTVLVNNAGISAQTSISYTKEGYELIWGTNHLGHFLLTILLLPVVKRRVVNVSSEVHDPETVFFLPDTEPDWPTTDEEYDRRLAHGETVPPGRTVGMRHYCVSKVCNIFFTFELARRLGGPPPPEMAADARSEFDALAGTKAISLPQGDQLKVMAFMPGLMLETNFIRGPMSYIMRVLNPLIPWLPVIGRLVRNAAESGASLADLALGSLEGDASAAVIFDRTIFTSSAFSRSSHGFHAQQDLWRHSLRWAKVTPEELAAAGMQA